QVGSVREVVAQDGSVAELITYDEFGNILADSAPMFQPFGFGGGHRDTDTTLSRFSARDYDPTTGRWTTIDPIGFAGGETNLFSFVGNDPINFNDPTGLYSGGVVVPPWAAVAYAFYFGWKVGSAIEPHIEDWVQRQLDTTLGPKPTNSPVPSHPPDPWKWEPTNPGRDAATGGCKPCPPDADPWEAP
ncbi:MAG: RHS repeat-associated core domain-containing protein, partial [Deltaproteobacteria bacterium]